MKGLSSFFKLILIINVVTLLDVARLIINYPVLLKYGLRALVRSRLKVLTKTDFLKGLHDI